MHSPSRPTKKGGSRSVAGCTRPPAMCDAHHLRRRGDGDARTLGKLVKREYDP